MAQPPLRSCNATGVGVYGTAMRNNLAEVSVSFQRVMRWYHKAERLQEPKTPTEN